MGVKPVRSYHLLPKSLGLSIPDIFEKVLTVELITLPH